MLLEPICVLFLTRFLSSVDFLSTSLSNICPLQWGKGGGWKERKVLRQNKWEIHLRMQITDSKIYVLWLASRKKRRRLAYTSILKQKNVKSVFFPPLPDGRAIIINERQQQWMPGTFVVCQILKSRCKQVTPGTGQASAPAAEQNQSQFSQYL